ncbi:MAG: hypothetical protein ACOH2B_02940 [Burkholderiaceae bacterium]
MRTTALQGKTHDFSFHVDSSGYCCYETMRKIRDDEIRNWEFEIAGIVIAYATADFAAAQHEEKILFSYAAKLAAHGISTKCMEYDNKHGIYRI